MTLTCSRCRRTNPSEAIYCYFDGTVLPGHPEARGGPVNAGTQRFATDFVFRSGRRCRNFDELALACVQERAEAVELLRRGYFESFLKAIGRPDLASFARQAARYPNRLRGLDLLVDKFPSRVVQPSKLQVEPLVINLGQTRVGEDRHFDLHLTNLGMRLLYGTVTVDDTPWLRLGGSRGVSEKGFDCEHELVMPVRVRGKRLKASPQPQQGRILIESSGGSAEVIVRIDVPVKPFPSGVLAGAKSQRQLAELAFKNRHQAGPHFERGEVAQWYADNGWIYPVQGPTASGLGALQQFLEACGLTQPPRVELGTISLHLRGSYGQRLTASVRVRAIDKKPVYAYAVSDQDWLIPQPAILNGTLATIPVEVPSVPLPVDGNRLKARLMVVANGRRKFAVPVTLDIFGSPPPVAVVATPADSSSREVVTLGTERRRSQDKGWLHVTPLALLLAVLLCLMLIDWISPRQRGTVVPLDPITGDALDDIAHLRVNFNEESHHRFGITLPGSFSEKAKKLTFDVWGRTNNTVVRIDDNDFIFGWIGGRPAPEHRNPRLPVEYQRGRGWRSTWVYQRFGITVTQDVSLRRSDQTGRLEICLIRYQLANEGSEPRLVGLRFMLDTFIGNNDGVPFTIPGRFGLCDTMMQFRSPEEVPDFVEALERPNLKDPGTVAHLTLKLDDLEKRLEPPTRVQLSAWPNSVLGIPGAQGTMTRWDVPMVPMKRLIPHDSAVIVYWDPKELAPGKTREMALAYGLGHVSSTAGQGEGKLAVSVSGSFRPRGEFTVTAYVSHPRRGEEVTLDLPDGLEIVDGLPATRTVRPSGTTPYAAVTWRVRSLRQGMFELRVRTRDVAQAQRVKITARSFLD